jgi:hypothetical protein
VITPKVRLQKASKDGSLPRTGRSRAECSGASEGQPVTGTIGGSLQRFVPQHQGVWPVRMLAFGLPRDSHEVGSHLIGEHGACSREPCGQDMLISVSCVVGLPN